MIKLDGWITIRNRNVPHGLYFELAAIQHNKAMCCHLSKSKLQHKMFKETFECVFIMSLYGRIYIDNNNKQDEVTQQVQYVNIKMCLCHLKLHGWK